MMSAVDGAQRAAGHPSTPAAAGPATHQPPDVPEPVAAVEGPRPVAVLVGAPGSGKSTVGSLLAADLGVALRDTDTDVETTLGMTVSDIFIEKGEDVFRAAERAAVAAALAEHSGVVALGGGAVLDARTRAALAGHTVVFLDVDLHDAVKRVGLARDRPLLVESPRARLSAQLRERRPLYLEVATIVVGTAGRAPEEVVAEVRAMLDAGHGA
jgi:shikimate kinase